MINKQLQVYHRFQRFIRITLSLCGCWYMPSKSGKSTYYWSVCAFLLMTFYGIISLNMSYILRHDLRNMMKPVGILISAIGALIKIGTFTLNRSSLINYHQILKNLFEEELEQNEKIRTIMLSSLYKIRTLAYTYATIMTALLLAYYLHPCFMIIRDLCLLRSPSTNYILPISRGIGHLWTVPDNFLYHFHFFLEMLLGVLSCTTASSIDSNFGFYVYHFVSTMQAMTYRLTNPLPTEKLSDILRTCVVKHQKLLQCRNTLEHIYGKIVFWHTVSNAVLLCSLIYDVSLSGIHLNNLFAFLAYALIKLFQTFMYAFYGTLLTDVSDEFRKGLYFGEWPNSSLDCHIRTNIILTMMQKPMTINAVFSTVDIVMFTNLVNSTMSYFFLLQSVSDE